MRKLLRILPIALAFTGGMMPVAVFAQDPVPTAPAEETDPTQSTGEPAYAEQNPRHRACILEIEADIETGRASAERWLRDGGGVLATHCLAVADLAAGYPRLAAIRLQTLGENIRAGDPLTRARLFAQAAEVWLSIQQEDAADTALGAAFALAPDAGELFLLAGRINHARRRWQAVIEAITSAEEQGFYSATGYSVRARAYKELTRFDPAAEDVAQALRIDPFHLDALVLRGELAQTGIIIHTKFRRVTPDTNTSTRPSPPTLKPAAAKPPTEGSGDDGQR